MNPQDNFASTPIQSNKSSIPPMQKPQKTSGLGVTMNLGFGSTTLTKSKEKRFPVPKTKKSSKSKPPESSPGIIYFLWKPEKPGFSFGKKPNFDYKITENFKEEFLKGKFDVKELIRVVDRLRFCPHYFITTDQIFKNIKFSVILLLINCCIFVPGLCYLGMDVNNMPGLENFFFMIFLIFLGFGGFFAFKAYEERKIREVKREKEFRKVLEIENDGFEKKDEEEKRGIFV